MSGRWPFIAGFSLVLIGMAGYVEQRINAANANVRVSMLDPRMMKLSSAPIRADWILEGQPDAEAALID